VHTNAAEMLAPALALAEIRQEGWARQLSSPAYQFQMR